jgi:translocator protein
MAGQWQEYGRGGPVSLPSPSPSPTTPRMPETSTIAAILWAVILGGAGGLLTTIGPWYRNLTKPSWQPPDWLFGPAWTLILGLAAWAAVLAWDGAVDDMGRSTIIILYAANFLCHLLWSPLFFTVRRPDWALFEVVFLWGSVLAMCIMLRPFSELASWLIVPYLVWVSFAAILNLYIVKLNGPFGRGTVHADPAD